MKHRLLIAIFLSTVCTAAFADNIEDQVFPEHITKWTGDSYHGSIDLTFKHDFGVIRAELETDDLRLISLTADQLENYVNLFTDPSAVSKYGDGQPWSWDEVEREVQKWIARWETSRDPFSAFAIFEKKKTNAFIGHIVLGHGSRYGQSELAFLFGPAFHNIGYATQAVTAILQGYVPRLIQEEYLVNLHDSTVDPSPLRSIHATGHFDDTFSGQALIRSGMKIGESDILWGAQRFHYLVRVDELFREPTPDENSLYDTGD